MNIIIIKLKINVKVLDINLIAIIKKFKKIFKILMKN